MQAFHRTGRGSTPWCCLQHCRMRRSSPSACSRRRTNGSSWWHSLLDPMRLCLLLRGQLGPRRGGLAGGIPCHVVEDALCRGRRHEQPRRRCTISPYAAAGAPAGSRARRRFWMQKQKKKDSTPQDGRHGQRQKGKSSSGRRLRGDGRTNPELEPPQRIVQCRHVRMHLPLVLLLCLPLTSSPSISFPSKAKLGKYIPPKILVWHRSKGGRDLSLIPHMQMERRQRRRLRHATVLG